MLGAICDCFQISDTPTSELRCSAGTYHVDPHTIGISCPSTRTRPWSDSSSASSDATASAGRHASFVPDDRSSSSAGSARRRRKTSWRR